MTRNPCPRLHFIFHDPFLLFMLGTSDLGLVVTSDLGSAVPYS